MYDIIKLVKKVVVFWWFCKEWKDIYIWDDLGDKLCVVVFLFMDY